MISRAHKIKLNPTKAQAVLLAKSAGTARFAYNWALDKWNTMYDAGKDCDSYMLCRMWTQERPEWAQEVGDGIPRKAIHNLGGAYKAFFKHLRKHPVFHKKGCRDSFYVANDKAKIYGNKIQLPRIGRVRMFEELRYRDAKITSYNVSRLPDGWYVTVSVELDEDIRTHSETTVGIDIGISNWAVSSDGTKCVSPGTLKDLERRLRRKQRLLSRKARGSNNRTKARLAVSKAYQKITNVKLDVIHKFTAAIAKNHGMVVIEDLDVKDMQENGNKRIRKGVTNSAMAEIHQQLMYKCNNYIKVPKWFPSSKTCSFCGNIKADLSLSDRTYHCPSCGHTIDRDRNAAMNLLNEGLRIITAGHAGSACGAVQ